MRRKLGFPRTLYLIQDLLLDVTMEGASRCQQQVDWHSHQDGVGVDTGGCDQAWILESVLGIKQGELEIFYLQPFAGEFVYVLLQFEGHVHNLGGRVSLAQLLQWLEYFSDDIAVALVLENENL